MSRLIDADALIEAVKDFPYGYRGLIVCTIAEQPTIEPERNKGKWIVNGKHPNYHLTCSECRNVAMWANGISYIYPNFCPNCGADMRGEE